MTRRRGREGEPPRVRAASANSAVSDPQREQRLIARAGDGQGHMDLGAAQSPRGYVPDILKPPPRDVPLAAKDLGSLHIATIASSLLLVLTIPTTAAGPLDEPTCDRDEYTYNSNTYYRHTIRETCTVKWTNDEICTFYVYTYDYTAVNRGEDGWEEYGPYESETGACVSTPLPPPTSP